MPAADTARTDRSLPPPESADAGNSRWLAWQAAVLSAQRDIDALNTRISAVDAKVYQSTATLSNSPSGLHQPLLHTFDKTKATQELRDGVAVTAAFGRAAYRAAGDYAGDKYKAAIAACGGGTNCPEAENWKDGGAYRAALHLAIGGMSFGAPGALGAGAGQAMLNVMDTAFFARLGITDPTAINLLKNAAVTMAGAAVGGTGGAAAAFNADANNRQLHPNEKERLRQLANGDVLKEQKLSAAACYLLHCSAEYPAGSEAQIGLQALERVGASLSQEIALLKQQADARGQMFTYSYWNVATDGVTRINSQYAVLTRLGGTVQALGGTAASIAGSAIAGTGLATCAPSAGLGCLAVAGGGLLALWGSDQLAAGTLAVASGVPRYTLGAHLLSEISGISLEAAELWYSVAGFATGTSAVINANQTTQEAQRLAYQWRLASGTYVPFSSKGIVVTDQVMGLPQMQTLIAEFRAAGNNTDDAIRYAKQAVESGTAMLNQGSKVSGELLFKVTPKNVAVTGYTPYWMSAQEAQKVSRMPTQQAADYLGLPAIQIQATVAGGGFDFYAIAVKPGLTATTFESVIASTEQRVFTTGGGAKQTIIPNRNLWTEAIKVDPKLPSTFTLKSGG